MIVAVNGTATELPDGATLAGVLAELEVESAARGVAVAVQGEVVPRRQWMSLALRDGDRVEVLSAIQGG
ncbi:MAG TPA: sulfur carrier protein ThiS [Solirubrobacteraceae bacterium]|jgi:sulfur carrier protein|nr:sulfur carrier protein ThiS [Solirubrobacteraceae bacterium]